MDIYHFSHNTMDIRTGAQLYGSPGFVMDALRCVAQSDGHPEHLEAGCLFLDVPPDTTTICGVLESIRNGGVSPSKVTVRFIQWDGAPPSVGEYLDFHDFMIRLDDNIVSIGGVDETVRHPFCYDELVGLLERPCSHAEDLSCRYCKAHAAGLQSAGLDAL